VWDSRGRPTVEVDVHAGGGALGRAIAPAGASRGRGRGRRPARWRRPPRWPRRDPGGAQREQAHRAGPGRPRGRRPGHRRPAPGPRSTPRRTWRRSAATPPSPPRWPWPGRRQRSKASRCGDTCGSATPPIIPSVPNPSSSRSPRSRSSGAAPMRPAASTCRTSWSSVPVRRRSPRRWSGRPRSTSRRDGHWRGGVRWPAWPMRAAGGRPSIATRTGSPPSPAPSRPPAPGWASGLATTWRSRST